MNRITGSKETSVYIIDADYRVVHFNNALTEVFPSIKSGELCYEVLCGESEPCRECPLSRKTNQGEGAIFYNKKVDRWLEVTTGEIDWPGAGQCYTVLCREIHEGNKNLFYNLTNVSTYDELFELNLTRDSYKILYHLEGKYVVPVAEGALSSMLADVMENMIHPKDRERFAEFWNMEEIFEKTQTREYGGTLRGEFRKKLVKGGYCWVSQTVVPLLYGENSDKIIMCFIQDINTNKLAELQSQKEIQESERDQLTGLYKKNVFFKKARGFLNAAEGEQYCLMAVDIEHFKLFNEWYGQAAGDQFLKSIARQLLNEVNRSGGIAGYMGDDDFCIILPNEDEILEKLQSRIMGYIKKYGDSAGFLPAFGVFNIEEKSTPIRTMYDRACIALASVKGNYARRVCHYDSRMMQQMEEDHVLLSEIQHALQNGEFTFYGQPKCNMATGKIVGLESLVRWNHPERGLIAPGAFIPMLERNGLIADLDLYLWEDVCKALRAWIDKGFQAIPISVNVSRMDIYTLDVVESFKKLIMKYDLPSRLVEIEITESAYAEENEHITNVINELRKAGFTVLMDDFGSGYSSLNMLKDVNVDVLKIDMKFLELDEQSTDKGMGILETIIRMARLMGMRIIAEGVETKAQMAFLLDMGCLYGQGYYFYRPMPREQFQELLKDEDKVDYRGIKARQTERIHIKDLLNEDAFSEVMLNNILGGIAFYDVHGEQIELTRVNELYYKVTGTNPVDLEEARSRILGYVYEEDRKTALQIFSDAYKHVSQGGEGEFRRYNDAGDIVWIHLRAFFLREQDGHGIYYGALSDVTKQKQKEEQLEVSQKALASVVMEYTSSVKEKKQKLELMSRKAESIFRLSDLSYWEWDIQNHRLMISNVNDHVDLIQICDKYQDENVIFEHFPDGLLNSQKISERQKVRLRRFINEIRDGQSRAGMECEVPLFLNTGKRLWFKLVFEVITDETGNPAYVVGYYLDITAQREELLESRVKLKALEILKGQSLYDFKANISRDEFMCGADIEAWMNDVKAEKGGTFTDNMEYLIEKVIFPEFRSDFRRLMNRDILLAMYKDGKRGISLDYKRLYLEKSRWLRMTVHLVEMEGSQDVFAYIFIMDIDEQKKQELRLTRMAETDALTGLYNRQTAIPKIKDYLSQQLDETAAMVMFDLDNFKVANDVFGHAYGDSIITAYGHKLQHYFREEDIICRIGGDEFMVFCRDIQEEDMQRRLAEVVDELVTVYENGGQKIKFTISAGFVMIPEQGKEFDELYRKADIALFTAKMDGKSSYRKYHESMKAIRYELADR